MHRLQTIIIICCVITTVSFESCVKDSSHEENDRFICDSIIHVEKNVFFDAPFGSTERQVIHSFHKNGFYRTFNDTTEGDYLSLHFLHYRTKFVIKVEKFSFLGLDWDEMWAVFYKNQFVRIVFCAKAENEKSAENEYERMKRYLAEKFKVNEIEGFVPIGINSERYSEVSIADFVHAGLYYCTNIFKGDDIYKNEKKNYFCNCLVFFLDKDSFHEEMLEEEYRIDNEPIKWEDLNNTEL